MKAAWVSFVQRLKARLPNAQRPTPPPAAGEPFQPPRDILRGAWLSLALGAIALTVWAALAPLSGAVIAEGSVKADGNRKTVQHQEGGIIKAIRVKDGDHVRAGQVLITLTDVRTDAMLDSLATQAEALKVRAARLMAERDYQSHWQFPAGAINNANSHIEEIIQRESALFKARRASLAGQIGLLRRQVTEVVEEIKTLSALVKTAKASQTLAEDETRLNQRLKDKGFISDARLMELARSHTDYRLRTESQWPELAKAAQKKTEIELKIAGLRSEYIRTATDELKETTNHIYKLDEEQRPVKDSQQRQAILAPVAGEIVDLKFFSAGAVIGPREAILDIAPVDTPLIVESRIKPENIKEIRVQSKADVRLTAYSQSSTPVIEGRVTYVGADRLTDRATNQPYYVAHVQISREALQEASRLAGQTLELSQGMQAEVFIRTQARSAFDYLMAPLTAGLRRGMRER